MGNCCPNCLIILGVYIFLMAGLLTIGFNFIVKTAVPIALGFLPLNDTLRLFTEVPLALDIKAVLTSASADSEVENNTLAIGHLGFNIEMAAWLDDSEETIPLVWIEEEARVDQFQRYLLLLSDGPLNYAKYYSVAVGGMAIGLGVVAGILAVLKRNKG